MVRDEAKYKTFTKPNLLYTTLTAAHIRLLAVRCPDLTITNISNL